MKTRANRVTERAAVNAARTLFEAGGCVFQEVDQANDYGKDGYVDLVDEEQVSGYCVAVQVKGGPKYRRREGYAIPVEGHEEVWRQAPMPVSGIVYDETSETLYWCDITSYLDGKPAGTVTSIPVSRANLLDARTLERVFKPHFRDMAKRRSVGQAILNLVSRDPHQRAVALMDCFGSGRSDPRVFILLRQLLHTLDRDEFRKAVMILTHATEHPDIFWSSENWVPPDVEKEVKKSFRWTHDEIIRFFSDIAQEEWQRGDMGQHMYSLLVSDPGVKSKVEAVAIDAVRRGDEDVAWAAFYLCIYWARNKAREKSEQLVTIEPAFLDLELAGELTMILHEQPFVTLFE